MKQYSFYNVDLIIDGVVISGFSDSAAIITASRSVPQHAKVMDARGKMVSVTTADKSGVITFDLLQTSDSNTFLQSRAVAAQNAGTQGNVEFFVPVQAFINDKMGSTVVSAINGFITMQPPVVRGTGITTNTWVLEFEQLTFVRGQTPDVNSGGEEA